MQPRRDFLKTALGISVAPAFPAQSRTISGGERAGRRLPIPSTGSKIKSVETFTSGSLSIVRVRTDTGQEGYGQIAPFHADISATVLHRMVAPQTLGKDPANLSMGTVFALHLLGAIRNAGPHVEFSIEPTSWTDGLFEPPLRVTEGKVPIPDGPGWGVAISPDWLAKAQRQVTERV